MNRWIPAVVLVSLLSACAGGDESLMSSDADPTVDFDIQPFEVDTGWPSEYQGARSGSVDSGWRLRFDD